MPDSSNSREKWSTVHLPEFAWALWSPAGCTHTEDRRHSKRSQTNLRMWTRDGWTPGSSSATPRIWLSPAEKRARRDGRRDGTCLQLRSQVRSEVKRTLSEEAQRAQCGGIVRAAASSRWSSPRLMQADAGCVLGDPVKIHTITHVGQSEVGSLAFYCPDNVQRASYIVALWLEKWSWLGVEWYGMLC